MSKVNHHSRLVIIIDEIDVALARSRMLDNLFWESMRFLSGEHSGHISFLLGSKFNPSEYSEMFGISSPFFNIFGYRAELGSLDKTDAEEMIASSPITFQDSDIVWILENSRLYPRALQFFCWELLTNLEDGNACDSWRKKALARSKHLTELD